jgi:hypothetical protein
MTEDEAAMYLLGLRFDEAQEANELFLHNLEEGAYDDVPETEIIAALETILREYISIMHELNRCGRRMKAHRTRNPSNIRRNHA